MGRGGSSKSVSKILYHLLPIKFTKWFYFKRTYNEYVHLYHMFRFHI